MGCRCPVVGSKGLQGSPCEERQEMPGAGPSWFQLAPMAPLQGMAGPRSQDGGVCGNCIKERGKNARQTKEERTKMSGKWPCRNQGQRRRREGTRCQGRDFPEVWGITQTAADGYS